MLLMVVKKKEDAGEEWCWYGPNQSVKEGRGIVSSPKGERVQK